MSRGNTQRASSKLRQRGSASVLLIARARAFLWRVWTFLPTKRNERLTEKLNPALLEPLDLHAIAEVFKGAKNKGGSNG